MMSRPPRHLKGFYSRRIRAFYDRHRKLINRTIATAGVFLALIIGAGFIPYSTGMLRKKVERICETSFCDTCSVKRISLVPWTGFSIDSISMSKADHGMVVQATIPHVRVSYHILPLLFKFVVIKNFALAKPSFRIVLPVSRPVEKRDGKRFSAEDLPKVLAGMKYAVIVRALSIDNGEFVVEQQGKPLLDGKGVDLSMKVMNAGSFSLAGKISCTSVRLGGLWDIRAIRATVDVNDFVVSLLDGKADFYQGKMGMSGSANLTKGTLEGLHFELSHANLQKLYEASRVGQGVCTGRLDGMLDLQKSTLAPDSLKGRGSVALSDVEVRNVPIQTNLVVLLAIPKLRDVSFPRLRTDLELRNGKLYTPNIRGDGDPLDVRSEGWVGLDGSLFETWDGIFSKDFVGNLPPIVERSLDNTEDGRKSFKCSVSGTFKNPQVKVDQRIVNRAVHNVIDEVAKGLGRLFKR
jgi:hypothetical protein